LNLSQADDELLARGLASTPSRQPPRCMVALLEARGQA